MKHIFWDPFQHTQTQSWKGHSTKTRNASTRACVVHHVLTTAKKRWTRPPHGTRTTPPPPCTDAAADPVARRAGAERLATLALTPPGRRRR